MTDQQPQPDHTFVPAPGSPFTLGSAASFAVTDLNEDGLLDFAFADGRVLFGQLDHTFTPAPGSPFAVGNFPGAIAVADLNGDERLDIAIGAISESGAGIVTLLLGRPNQSFVPAAASPVIVGPFQTYSVVIADIDADPFPDLVAVNAGSGDVSVLVGTGHDSFAPAPGSPISVGALAPEAAAVANVNGDGFPDVITANFRSNNVSVLLGRPDRSFAPAPGSPFAVGGAGPNSVAVADLNGDGLLDVVTTNDSSGDMSVLFGQTDQTFVLAPGSPFTVGEPYTASAVVTDLNNDGLPDVLTAAASPDTGASVLSVLLGQPDHTLVPAPGAPFDVGGIYPVSIALADLNGDGLLDVVTANEGNGGERGSVSVLFEQPDHSFVLAPGAPLKESSDRLPPSAAR